MHAMFEAAATGKGVIEAILERNVKMFDDVCAYKIQKSSSNRQQGDARPGVEVQICGYFVRYIL
jgi:hypothetical protein